MTEQKSCHRPMEGVALQGVIFSVVTCVCVLAPLGSRWKKWSSLSFSWGSTDGAYTQSVLMLCIALCFFNSPFTPPELECLVRFKKKKSYGNVFIHPGFPKWTLGSFWIIHRIDRVQISNGKNKSLTEPWQGTNWQDWWVAVVIVQNYTSSSALSLLCFVGIVVGNSITSEHLTRH